MIIDFGIEKYSETPNFIIILKCIRKNKNKSSTLNFSSYYFDDSNMLLNFLQVILTVVQGYKLNNRKSKCRGFFKNIIPVSNNACVAFYSVTLYIGQYFNIQILNSLARKSQIYSSRSKSMEPNVTDLRYFLERPISSLYFTVCDSLY